MVSHQKTKTLLIDAKIKCLLMNLRKSRENMKKLVPCYKKYHN